MKNFRAILREVIKKDLAKEPVALLFSGGTDSLTLLWTLLDLGAEVTCYTFRLERVESNDSKAARLAADTWQVPIEVIQAPYQEPGALAGDVREVIRIIQSARKTHVEVMWGYWYLIRAIKEQQVWSGLQADTLYGSSKSMAIKYAKQPQAFLAARRKMVTNPDQEGYKQAHKIAAYFDKEFYAPYTSPQVREFMFSYSWAELNKPKQKMPAVIGFEPEFRQVPIYRRNDNLQCGSGIREYFARLLSDPLSNPNNRRNVQALYKDFLYNNVSVEQPI